jgi:hypothetical protein
VALGDGAPALNAARHTDYFTGRSDNFDPATASTAPDAARLDPEAVRVSADGRHVYIADEDGPHIYEFDRLTGLRVRSFTLPAEFAVAAQSPRGDVEIAGNTAGRVANKGMEGLAITPDSYSRSTPRSCPASSTSGCPGADGPRRRLFVRPSRGRRTPLPSCACNGAPPAP